MNVKRSLYTEYIVDLHIQTTRTNMIRHTIFTIFCLTIAFSAYAVDTHIKDSLLQQLTHTTEPSQRIRIYRNLADVCFESPDEKTYLLKMYHEADRAGDKVNVVNALTDIIYIATDNAQTDSISYYINLIKKAGTPETIVAFPAYIHMRYFDTLCYDGKTAEAIDNESDFLKDNSQDKQDVYNKIAKAYITGSSLRSNGMMKKALPYLKTAYDLSQKISDIHIRYMFKNIVGWRLSNTYSRVNKRDSATCILEEFMHDQLQYYDTYYKEQRPYYNIATRMLQTYSMILTNTVLDNPQKAHKYWLQIVALSKELTSLSDRYNYYLSMSNYYISQKPKPDYEKALLANDSLIKFAPIIAPSNMPGLYNTESDIYEAMGKYKEALEYLKLSYQSKDSLTNNEMLKQLSELQVKYDINKLNNEKSQLEIKNKRILLVFLSSILIIVVAVCLYLFYSLRKERNMKISLQKLNQKAMESENMKTAFINSICHEIRTPLNAIVGFSDLIFNEEIDEEIRQEFPKEIQSNTAMLITLINNMLEVSSLDVSKEKLPCVPTDINNICQYEMDLLMKYAKPDITYQLDLLQESILIPTHEKYLSLVVEHLLNNANKFTEKGSITLSCRLDTERQQLSISVSDTGCGIPKDKYEEVFKRFSKLNTFVQGNGLGLYLCQLIINRLSGDIYIDPAYNQGTRVIVTLPIV